MRVCRSIGTDLLAVEYDDKDSCIAKLTKSNNLLYHLKTFSFLPTLISEHRGVQNLDYWTSGSQKDCPGKMSWCSLERPVRNQNLSWASSGDGDCVSVKYGPNATSTFTKTDCEKQLPFICEVIISCFLFAMMIKNQIKRFTTREHLVKRCRPSAWKFGTYLWVRFLQYCLHTLDIICYLLIS